MTTEAALGDPATLRTDAVVVRYTTDQVAALCELFERPDVLAALEDSDDADGPQRTAVLGAAARSLVSGWIVSYDDDPAGERLQLLEPHAQVLGALWSATGLVSVTRETDVAAELVVIAAVDGTVVERREVLPGVHSFTLAPGADATDRVLRFLGVAAAQQAPDGAAFATTGAALGKLERFAVGAASEAVPDMVAEAGFAAAVTMPISHGRITVLRRQDDGFAGDDLSWVEGDDGVWLVDLGDGGDDSPAQVRPVAGSDLQELVAAALA